MSLPIEQLIKHLLKEDLTTISEFLGYTTDSYENLEEKIEEVAIQMPEEELTHFFEKYNIDPYDPNERQQNCKYAFCYMGKKHNQTYCRHDRESKNEGESYVTNEQCDECPHFKSKFIEYPIQVNKINTEKFNNTGMHQTGTLVAIQPCGKEYKNKTYLGIYLGNLPYGPHVSYNEERKELSVKGFYNPAIYVFELKKIIFGMESWWQTLQSIDDFKEITKEDIENQPYVKMLRQINHESKPEPTHDDTKTVKVHVSMDIDCPAKNEEKLRRYLDHHIEYLVDLDNNMDVIKSIYNVKAYTDKKNDDSIKLMLLRSLIDDVLKTEPSDEELENKDDVLELYEEIHNLKQTFDNLDD